MARYVDLHPENPQARLVTQVVEALRDDALIAYPTDSGYALGCQLGNRDGRDRILRIRDLDERHHFTLMCKDFAQLGEPILTSTLILPGETEARTLGWEIKEELDHQVDLVIDAGEVIDQPTTVIDWSGDQPEVVREGAGDASRFLA